MECQCSVYSISLIMRRLALTTKLLYDIRETIKRKWVSYAVMQRGRAGKNSGLKWDMIPNLVRLCCTLLYCQSYQQLGAGQMKTLFYTQYWVSEDKYFHCVKCHKQHKLFVIVMISLTPYIDTHGMWHFMKCICPEESFRWEKRRCCFSKTQEIWFMKTDTI